MVFSMASCSNGLVPPSNLKIDSVNELLVWDAIPDAYLYC